MRWGVALPQPADRMRGRPSTGLRRLAYIPDKMIRADDSDAENTLRRTLAWLLVLTILFMVYASLFPFEFDLERLREASRGEWLRLFEWRRPPRSDLIANFLFYLPFGGLLAYLAPRRWSAGSRWLFVVGTGTALSGLIELAQFATRDRDPSLTDVAVNAASAGLAAAGALAFARLGFRPSLPQLRARRPEPLALLLVLAWLAVHAAPFMPTASFVRYFRFPELLLQHTGSPAALAAYFAGFTILGAALRSLLRPGSFWPVFGAVAAASLVMRIGFRGQHLELAECAGLALALPVIWHFERGREPRALQAAGYLIGLALLCHGLAPLSFTMGPPDFAGLDTLLLARRTGADELGLLEIAFLYGGYVWFLAEAGVPLRRVVPLLLIGAGLVELAQAWQPGRSAHPAGPLAVLLGAVLVRLRGAAPGHRPAPTSDPRRLSRRREA